METLETTSGHLDAIRKIQPLLIAISFLLGLSAQSCDDGRIEPFKIPVNEDDLPIWRAPIKTDTSYSSTGYLYYHNDRLILMENYKLEKRVIICYSASDGKKLWEWDEFDERDIDPYINFRLGTGFSGNFFYTLTDCFDYVIDIETGKLAWKYYNIHSNKTAYISGSTLYRTRIYNDIPNNDSIELYVTDLSAQDWKLKATFHSHGNFKVELGSVVVDPYIYPDTVIYFHIAYNDFSNLNDRFDFYAWNQSTNSMIWHKENPGKTVAANIFESVVDKEKVYFHCGNAIYAFDKYTGEPQWENKLSYYALTANWIKAESTIVTVTNYGELVGINSNTGLTSWKSNTHLPFRLVPFRDGFTYTSNELRFGNADGEIEQAKLIFNPEGTYEPFKEIFAPPCVDHSYERIFLHDQKFIYCYNPDKISKHSYQNNQ